MLNSIIWKIDLPNFLLSIHGSKYDSIRSLNEISSVSMICILLLRVLFNWFYDINQTNIFWYRDIRVTQVVLCAPFPILASINDSCRCWKQSREENSLFLRFHFDHLEPHKLLCPLKVLQKDFLLTNPKDLKFIAIAYFWFFQYVYPSFLRVMRLLKHR